MTSTTPTSPARPRRAQPSLAKLWRISRPRFWIYVFGPYIVGLIAGAASLDALRLWPIVAFGLFFLWPANILIYGVNDVFDYETDIRNAKKEKYEALLHPGERPFLWAVVAFSCLPFLSLLSGINPYAFASMMGFLFFSLFYSMPPIRAKTKPILDSVFNVLYIFPGVFAYFLVGGHNFYIELFLAAWCWAMAMHAYSAVPDITADRQANINTIATLLGFKGTLWFCLVLYALAAILSFQRLGALSLVLGLVYVGLMRLSLKQTDEAALLAVYKWFPLVNTAAGFVLFWATASGRFFSG